MVVNSFRPEEKLYGSANYNSWKAKLTTNLEENDLDDIVLNVIEEPTQMLEGLLTRGSKVRLEGSSMIQSESQ